MPEDGARILVESALAELREDIHPKVLAALPLSGVAGGGQERFGMVEGAAAVERGVERDPLARLERIESRLEAVLDLSEAGAPLDLAAATTISRSLRSVVAEAASRPLRTIKDKAGRA